MVVTCGSAGVRIYDNAGSKIILPAAETGKRACDANGAGDTFTAAFSVAYLNKAPLLQAAFLGNVAAGISVTKPETSAVEVGEILEVLRRTERPLGKDSARKIVSLEELMKELQQLRADRKQIVFTNGCFDLLHAGHVEYLQAARNFEVMS